MANSYSGSLLTQFLLEKATTVLQNRLAALACFTRQFTTDPYKPLATAQLKFVTAGAAGQTNASNFESGDSTVTNIAVTVNHLSQSFHVTTRSLTPGCE